MRILFFHRWVGIRGGGTETHIRELVQRLSAIGHEVHVLTLQGDRLNNFENIRVWTLSRSRGESAFADSYGDPRSFFYTVLYLAKAFMKLFALRRRGLNFDVVSVHFVTEGILMLALRRIFGWPFVFIMEGYNILEARVAKWADQVIAISNDIVRKCEFAHGFRPSHIPIGVDKNRFSPSVDGAEIRSRLLRGGQKLVLCVCRLEPRKDLPTLILAMKQVCSKMEARLVVVGDGLLKNQLERLIQESGLSESVRIDTEAVYDDLPQYYRAADVFALPTLYEGLGIVFLEAMSSETPIVSTRVDGVTEILGSAGLLVPPRNPNALADAITQVLTNEGLRETLITSGRRTVAAFEWEPLVYRYDSVYKQAAQSFTDLASQG